VGAEATTTAVTDGLPSASVVHLAAHGHLRTDQPLWSAIELADGPLTVYDLVPHSPLPPTIVLSACDAGISAARGGGDELLGFTATLLAAGARSIVAAVAPLPDTALTRTVMVALHRGLAAGLPAGAALDRALNSALDGAGDPDVGADLRMVLSVFGRA
jgi:CHAT domain-containing protein